MKRKRYSQEFRMQVVKEALETGNASLVARRHELHSGIVSRWVREYQDQTGSDSTGTSLAEPLQNKAEFKKMSSENDQLKKLLGEKELEIIALLLVQTSCGKQTLSTATSPTKTASFLSSLSSMYSTVPLWTTILV